MSLVLRRGADGAVRVIGGRSALPAEHAFAPGFIERGIAEGYVSVQVTVKSSAGDVVYDLREFTDDDGARNVTAWRCALVDEQKD